MNGQPAILLTALLAILASCATPRTACAAPLDTGEATFVLEDGAGAECPMTLTLALHDGTWSPNVWGRAVDFNFSQHEGQLTVGKASGDAIRLTVDLTVATDLVAVGGGAHYVIDAERHGDLFAGSYAGTFLDSAAKGNVSGRMAAPSVRVRPDVPVLQPGEHPRLIFRRAALPELRRRLADTPEGKAIESMLLVRSPLRLVSQVTDRHASWMAANWAAIYQLTGEKANAVEARAVLMEEVINRSMPADRDDIHHAPRLLGIALAYDLGYEAWDAPFRQYLAEFILMTAEELAAGLYEAMPMMAGTVDPTPWNHRNAIRMACVGVAALAVLGDPDADGQPLARARRLYDRAERDVVAYLRDGITGAGRGLEGPTVKSIALSNGVLQFMNAARVAMGRDLSDVNPFLQAGPIVSARDIDPENYRFGISSISVQASGRWPMGLGCVPDAFLPAMKWCFDRSVGLGGMQHFDCTYPYQAAYAIHSYPFAVASKEPGDGLPLAILDRTHGEFVFRNRWRDNDDILTVLDLGLGTPPGLGREAAARIGALTIAGFGTTWVDGRVGLPLLNEVHGAELLYADAGTNGQAFVGARLDRMYARGQRASWQRPSRLGRTDPVVFPPPRFAPTEATGIQCTRHFAVDYSGAAGVPALFVIVDQLKNADKQRWLYPNGPDRKRPNVLGDPAGTNLTWHFARGKAVQGYVEAGDLCVAVATLGTGPAPALQASGDQEPVRITVGGQTITFDGRRIAFSR